MVTPRKTKINTRKDQKKGHTRNQVENFESLTPSLSLQLAAPHTWVSAIIPVLVSAVYVGVTYSGKINIVVLLVLLAISILMQSSVNTLNDYFDFKKGTDSLDNSSEDSFDAVLVYHQLKPHHVLCLGIGYLAAALRSWLLHYFGQRLRTINYWMHWSSCYCFLFRRQNSHLLSSYWRAC